MALPRDTDRGGSLAPHRPSREIYGHTVLPWDTWATKAHQDPALRPHGSSSSLFVQSTHLQTGQDKGGDVPAVPKGAVSEGHEQGEIPQYRKNRDAEPDWE